VRMKSICFPPSAFCLPPIAFCLLPTAYCISGEFELAGLLARTAVYDKMSPPKRKEKTSNFKK
jgi:hypothetical protein